MMAYMSHGKLSGGPYPNKSGEFCGNHLKGSEAFARGDETHEQAQARLRGYLATMRFGRPRPYEDKTTAEMEASGHVGLYLKEDESWKLGESEVPCPTPPELLEPAPAPTPQEPTRA